MSLIPHVLIVDDEEDVLDSLVPGFVSDFGRRLVESEDFQKANAAAGFPLPRSGRLNIAVSATGYRSGKLERFAYHRPVHLQLHLCCEKGGSFRHVLRLLKEHFVAAVVSDLRFSDDAVGSRAGRYLIEDIHRRNPDTFAVLYSAYQKPDGFPDDRFIRKGSAANLAGEKLIEKLIEGVGLYLRSSSITRLASELKRRGIVYQSEAFGSMLRRFSDYSELYFSREPAVDPARRRPRPTLLIDGETGTGKTELANLLHQLSQRREFPFVQATCNQLTDETFLRSILFGHIKGAFSGATTDRPGLVQTAEKGVLLLDDLHKLTDGGSAILHSFLDDGRYCHLGEDEVARTAEAAIVGTVETPIWEEIKAESRLSESFLNRVEQLVVRIPPLRDRPEDIAHQAQHYCRLFGDEVGQEMELSDEAIEWVVEHGLPGGNSRKLRDLIRGLVTSHARVTDYLDIVEMEEYAAEMGLVAPKPVTTSSAVPASLDDESTVGTVDEEWPPSDGEGWSLRVVELARAALGDQTGLEGDDLDQVCRALFLERMPDLWRSWQAVAEKVASQGAVDIKLIDELFRYFAIFRAGNPARAAKELGMKDNALREFVYSREQKRGTR
ncbi:Regulatory protein LuxO [Planctomycetes bacterium Pan216]|uniref:Regulatory protein LuxO n=1 Tax=Kolteria novifilia TaxID=2527975 RepID=A0A518AYI7_9BACT|nr:Regulatory protein LuxO [Planctomycetes bacterium Pan216]